jgi:hypothetical protein
MRNSRSPHEEPQRNAKTAYLCATRYPLQRISTLNPSVSYVTIIIPEPDHRLAQVMLIT